MAVPPAALAQIVAGINVAFAGVIATPADIALAVAPLASLVQLQNAVAPLATQAATQAQLAAMQAQIAAQFAAMQVQLAAIQALLAPVNVPAIAAAATAVVQSIVAARMENKHDHSGPAHAYEVVLLADGTVPPNWPPGFERVALVSGPIAVVDALLNDYGLPNGPPGALVDRRDALALHIGTTRV